MKAIRSNNASKGITKSSAIEEWRDGFDALLEGNTLPGISTKIPEFDQKIGGLKPGKLYVFAGKSGTGKTTLMLNLLIAAAKTGHACVLFSGEMTEVELVEVCCAILAFTRYRQVNFNEGHIVKLDSKARTDLRSAAGWATVELERLPLYLRCIPGMTPTQLRYECKAMKQQYGIELVAVDYIQIMQSGLNGRDVNREREIAYITEELKRMAMDNGLRLPLLAGSQVNAEGDLRESKAIGHHADVVVFLNSEGDGKLKATFQKNRRGPTGDVDLYFKRESSVIGSIGK
jgi:replicative DNA helicase